MDNVQLNFFGNENNVDRFVYEIFKIWSRSEFALVDNELYTYSTNSPGILSIHPLNPNASYTFEMNGTTLISELETSWNTAHEIPEEWSFSHDIFQPIMTNIEGSNSWKLPSIPFPAFILNVSKNAADIETTLAGCNFVLDIALTFSGVGSLTKLSMIPSKFRLFKATIATVEIGSSLADLLMNHSDMCVGQEELCKKWKVLTFSLQLFSLTGDVLIRNSIKKYTRDYLDELYKTGNDIPTNTKNQLTLIAEESILETLKKRLQDAGISDMSIVNQLDNWNNGTLNKLYQITADPNYVGLLNEFVSDVSLLDKFRLVEETWWAKYPMAGLCKRTGSTVPTQFKKYIGDIEVTPTVGGKLNLRDAEVLDHLSSQYIGKLFDDEMAYQIKNSWISGDFTNFPPNIADYLKDLHLKNYKLVIEPQVSILDENPKPDLLFFGSKKVGSITKTDVIYLEVKYLSDVPFTNPQKAILNNLPATVIEKNSNELRDNVTNEILVLQGQSFVINEAHKLTVNKNTFQMEIQ
jgi:hypothetical protein